MRVSRPILYVLATTLLLPLANTVTRPALAACEQGEALDGTTLAGTKAKIEAAGFTAVRDFSKGCDNFWHAKAMKDGVETGVVVTPDGRVLTESLL